MAAKTPKHGKCIRHDKLPCGCKVCVTPNSTAYNDPLSLIAFHAMIHRSQAQRAARPRLPADGRIEGPNGERLTPSQLMAANEAYTPNRNNIGGHPYALAAFLRPGSWYASADRLTSRLVTAEERSA